MAANHRAIEAASATYERRRNRPTHLRLVPPPPGVAEVQARAAQRRKLTNVLIGILLFALVLMYFFAG